MSDARTQLENELTHDTYGRPKLRIGVLIASLSLHAWEGAMLHRLVESDYAEIVLLVISGAGKERAPRELEMKPAQRNWLTTAMGAPLRAIYRALEGKITCEHDAFTPCNGEALLGDLPRIMLESASDGAESCSAGELLQIEALQLDVWIHLGGPQPPDGLRASAKYGSWSLQHTHCDAHDFAAAGFWPVYYDWPVIETVVVGTDARQQRILARSFSGTNRFSIKLNRSALFWKTSALLPRKLKELRRLGAHVFFSQAEALDAHAVPQERSSHCAPTNTQLAIHLARNVKRRTGDFLLRHLALDRWILLYHLGQSFSTAVKQFSKIIPPKDRFWADPHVLRRGRHYYVFVEEFVFSTGKGHIAVLILDEHGRQQGESAIALERDYHLSYPCVFEHGNEVYMIPESSANRTIDLYRCSEFPTRWEFVRTLLHDIAAVDTTVLWHDGKWWLFAGVMENEGASFCEELFVFHAQTLLDEVWVPHALNPVVSDVRKARPAGAIFCHQGKLYRPAQDCSVRYGYAMTLNQITSLSESAYTECEVRSILPDWDRDIIATHTYAYAPGLTVIDALQPRLKL